MVDIVINEVIYRYESNPVHRNGTAGKSQWTIPNAGEQNTFSMSIERGWQVPPRAWGFHMPKNVPDYLGIDRDHTTQLFIARFEAKSRPPIWHGYPINHRDHCPPLPILNRWLTERILPKAKISKINCGKKCNL